jgi:hypothetical protein
LLRGWIKGTIREPACRGAHLRFLAFLDGKVVFAMSNFGDFIWLIASTFLFVGCLLILFRMISDLFQDSALGGGSKALWRICLLFVPMLTALVYVVTPSKGMVKRQRVSSERSRSAAEPYIQQVAGTSPAEQIPDAQGAARCQHDQSGRVRQAQKALP